MGSVQGEVECPNCKLDAIEDYRYKTDETYISCLNCGYLRRIYIKRDENGKVLPKDPSKATALDNVIWIDEEIKNPFGAIHLETDNIGQYINLDKPVTAEEILAGFDPENMNSILKITLNRFIDGKIKNEIIYEKQKV